MIQSQTNVVQGLTTRGSNFLWEELNALHFTDFGHLLLGC